MKFTYFSHSRIPSQEANSLHVIFMAAAMAELGAEVTLVSWPVKNRKALNAAEITHKYGVTGIIEHKLYKHIPVPGFSYVSALFAAVCAWLDRVDLIFGRNLRPCFFAALLGRKVIYETHQPVATMSRLDRFFIHQLVKRKACVGFVTISTPLADILRQEIDFGSTPLIVAGDAANPVKSGSASLVKSGSASPFGGPYKLHVGYIGSLYEGRGIETILEMANAMPDCRFHIVGGTKQNIDDRHANAAVPKNVVFHGFLDAVQAERLRLSCDVLLAPYQKNTMVPGGMNTVQWMSPMKIFEYMAAGKAILCSDLPVLYEILEHEKTGLFVDPADTAAWVKALTRLRDDSALSKKLGKQALAEHKKNRTWSLRCQKILAATGVSLPHDSKDRYAGKK